MQERQREEERFAHSTVLNNFTGIAERGKSDIRVGNSSHKKSILLDLFQLSRSQLKSNFRL